MSPDATRTRAASDAQPQSPSAEPNSEDAQSHQNSAATSQPPTNREASVIGNPRELFGEFSTQMRKLFSGSTTKSDSVNASSLDADSEPKDDKKKK